MLKTDAKKRMLKRSWQHCAEKQLLSYEKKLLNPILKI
jgi:hypothetical protein